MAKILPEDEVDNGIILDEKADLVASGYEATCPGCQAVTELIEVPSSVDVVYRCEVWFKVSLPEHAYA